MDFQVPFPVANRARVVAIIMSEGCLPRGYWTKDPRSGLVHEAVGRKQVNRLQPESSWPNLYFSARFHSRSLVLTPRSNRIPMPSPCARAPLNGEYYSIC